MDIGKRIKEIMEERRWTKRRLARESGITIVTLKNIIDNKSSPTLSTVEAVCKGFGIHMSQFFSENNNVIEMTPELKELFDSLEYLSESQKELLKKIMKELKNTNQRKEAKI